LWEVGKAFTCVGYTLGVCMLAVVAWACSHYTANSQPKPHTCVAVGAIAAAQLLQPKRHLGCAASHAGAGVGKTQLVKGKLATLSEDMMSLSMSFNYFTDVGSFQKVPCDHANQPAA